MNYANQPPASEVEDLSPDKRRRKPKKQDPKAEPIEEIGGPAGPEPTRYGDWERKGIISDF